MWLTMKKFNVLGVRGKVRLLWRKGGGGSRKANIAGGLPKNGELRQFVYKHSYSYKYSYKYIYLILYISYILSIYLYT